MADYLGMLKGEQLISLSENFDYVTATADFVGLKLFPAVKTNNMKLAIAQLTKGGKIPVMALVHAFDTESRIEDRPNYETMNLELLLIKAKLNQGESIRKLRNDLGMPETERNILRVIFDDANNLISRILTRVEAMCNETLCTGKVVIDENGYKTTVDYNVPSENILSVADWDNPDHDIFADLMAVKRASKDKITDMLINDVVMGYILNNKAFKQITASYTPIQFLTEDFAKSYISGTFGIKITVNPLTYKKDALDTTEYKFVPDNRIAFFASKRNPDGSTAPIGNTFFTSTPDEDYGIASQTSGFVAVTQYQTADPAGVWTKASAVALPCPSDPATLYPCTITKTPAQGAGGDSGS